MDKSSIVDILRKAASANAWVIAAVGDALGIGSSGSQALLHLSQEDKLTPGQLAGRLSLTSAAVTALMDRLEKGDYIRRDPNPSDRRSLVIELTDHGQARLARTLQPLRASLEELVNQMTEAEQQVILEFMDRLATILEKESTTIRLDEPQPASGVESG